MGLTTPLHKKLYVTKYFKAPLNRTRQLLVYADDINFLGDNKNAIKENTETLIEASRDVGLEINAEKSKHMITSRHQNSGQN
jgi:hypothetical protein